MRRLLSLISIGVLVASVIAAWPARAQLSNGLAANGVLGPSDLTTRPAAATTASRFNGPNGVVIDPVSGKLFVADRANNRVLRWSSADKMTNGSSAEAVLGQPDFVTASSAVSAVKMNNPIGLYLDPAGRLWIGDYGNNRVLRFDDAANKANGAAADGVLGQPDFTTNSAGVTQSKFSTTRFFIASMDGWSTGRPFRFMPPSMTIAMVSAACSAPITAVCAFGHEKRNLGLYARPHMP